MSTLVCRNAEAWHASYEAEYKAKVALEARLKEQNEINKTLSHQLERRADGMDPLTQNLRNGLEATKILLQKYIRYVADCEGTSFLYGGRPENFSEEEWTELQKLDGKISVAVAKPKKPERITPGQLEKSLTRIAEKKETNE